MDVIAVDHKLPILEVHSYGFESEFNECGGRCDYERATILRNTYKGKRREVRYSKTKEDGFRSYNMTYEFTVLDLVNGKDSEVL